MAEFLTTRGTSHYIENIIIEAKIRLILVSPFLQLSKTLFERLKDASARGVKIKIIYGKDELKPNERNSLAELKNIELLFHENLHAKCYFNETKMVITSMNMYQFSENTNREMGILIDSKTESDLFNKAFDEATSIIQHSEIIPLKRTERTYYNTSTINENKFSNRNKPQMGYCIKCESRITLDMTRPYCPDCYMVWAQFKKTDYEETVCHSCGQFNDSSMAKPVCWNCYKQLS